MSKKALAWAAVWEDIEKQEARPLSDGLVAFWRPNCGTVSILSCASGAETWEAIPDDAICNFIPGHKGAA